MSNEELVIAIQAGNNELIGKLWLQIYKFIDMRAGRMLDSFPDYYRTLQSDMVNESYFGTLEAVKHYEPEKGSFLNYLSWYIKNCFEKVLYGGRGSRLKNEPLNQAISIDFHLEGTEDFTLTDTLIDETSEAYFRALEDEDFWISVNELLNEAIEHIRDCKGAELVKYMFYNDSTLSEASRALYKDAPVQRSHYKKAIRDMQIYMRYSTVKKQMEAIGLDDYVYCYGTGITSFKNNVFTSSVELLVMKKHDEELRNRRLLEVMSI